MEIFSYGSPLRVQFKEDFLNAFRHPINKELNIVFMKVELSEHSGKGVSTILKKYGSGVFDFESKTSFTVSIPFNTKAMKAETSESGFTEKFTENEIKIIQIIMRNSSAKTGEMANELGISRRAVQNNL